MDQLPSLWYRLYSFVDVMVHAFKQHKQIVLLHYSLVVSVVSCIDACVWSDITKSILPRFQGQQNGDKLLMTSDY